MKIKIGKKEYNVEVAETEAQKLQGLQGRDSLGSDEGMLFIYEKPQDVAFWMKDTKIPLDIIFIDEDQEVISIAKGEPMSEDLMEETDVQYVLELNQDSGVKEGDEVYFEEDEDESKPVMKVLLPNGETQMELEGGERIVSRRETKMLIRKAKIAYESKNDEDYKKLGRYMFRILKGQDTRDPEYVELPNK